MQAARAPSLRVLLEQRGIVAQAGAAAADRDRLVILEGVLREDARPGEAGVSLSVAVDSATLDGRRHVAEGGMIVSVGGTPPAQRIDEWRAGRRLRFSTTARRPSRYLDPGVPDDELALARRGTSLVGSVKSAWLVELVARGTVASEIAARARHIARRRIGAAVGQWSERSAGIVTAILIGDRTGLDSAVERRLQDAGTYHVIAISGGNIAIFAGLLLGGMRLMGLSRRDSNLVPIAALVAYAYVAGGGSSVARATLMAVAYLAAGLVDHRSSPLNGLAVAAALILTTSPLAIYDAGFVLTFGATLAILVGSRYATGRLMDRRWLRPVIALSTASLSAEIALLPVNAFVFSRVTFAGLILNFAAIPMMSLAQIAGLAVLALEPLHRNSARLAGLAAHLGAGGLVESAGLVDRLPWLVDRVPRPSLLIVSVYYAGLMTWIVSRKILKERGSAGRFIPATARAAILVTAGSAAWILAAPAVVHPSRHALTVKFVDVGQGDSALVEFSNGRSLLVDTGGRLPGGRFDVGSRVLAPVLWHDGLRRLNYLAITHGDPDHMGGSQAVMRDFAPAEVWVGVPVPRHQPTNDLRAAVLARGAAWRTLQAGDHLEVGETLIHIWHPPPPEWERQRVRNDDSLVIELRCGGVSMLLTGDIGRDVERDLIVNLPPAAIRIVKVPHHGSATSSSDVFVAAIRPDVAVFSVGRDNRFGHPVPTVVDRYRQEGAAIFRTDLDGAVTVETDGRAVEVTGFTGRRLTISPRRTRATQNR